MRNVAEFTYDAMAARISPPNEASDAGIKDGARNLPRSDATGLVPYRSTILGRAKGEHTSVTNWLHRRTQGFYQEAQTFCVEPTRPQQVCGAQRREFTEEIEEQVNLNRAVIDEARAEALEAQRSRTLTFEMADAQPPTDEPDTLASFAAWALLLIVIEGLLTYWVLAGAVEPWKAVVSGLAAPALMYGLGALSGFLWLRPVKKTERWSWKRIGKLVIASVTGLFAAGTTAVVAAWRSALVSGLPGSWEDTFAVLTNLPQWIGHWETLTLFGLSGIAYAMAFYKVRHFFLGHDPELRKRELAWRKAEANRARVHDRVADLVKGIAAKGRSKIRETLQQTVDGVQKFGRSGQALKGDILLANRTVGMIQDVLDAADARYIFSNEHARTDPAPSWQALEAEDTTFEVPDAIDAHVSLAAETCEDWIAAANLEAGLLSNAEFEALTELDAIADLRPPADRLPMARTTLPWRVS